MQHQHYLNPQVVQNHSYFFKKIIKCVPQKEKIFLSCLRLNMFIHETKAQCLPVLLCMDTVGRLRTRGVHQWPGNLLS